MKNGFVSLVVAGLAIGVGVGCGGSVTDPFSSGSGGSSTGGGTECTGFEDAESTTPVTLRFHNNTGIPVYLSANCGPISYAVEPAGGGDGTSYNFSTSCMQTCEDLQKTGPVACAADCALMAYEIPSGGTREIAWSGLGVRTDEQMPEACYAEPNGAGACQRIVAAKADTYRVNATGYAECQGNCMCNPDGQCFGQASGAQATTDPVTFAFPGTQVVDVVFNVCAFGCAEDSSSADRPPQPGKP